MASKLDVKSVLRNMPLFQQLTDSQLDEIHHATTEIRAERGDMLFQKGDSPSGIHHVIFGQVKLAFSSEQGAEKVLQIFGPGQSFGEAVVFLDRPYPVYAQALADVLILHVDKNAIFAALARDVGLARKMLGGLSLRLHELVRDVESYSLNSAIQRVIGYLLNSDLRQTEDNKGYVELPASKHVIASRLNLTPETLSRIFNQLSAEELIQVENRTIHLLDIARLQQYA
ncbi:Crp/Fnr family transcriptional regulator [Leeia oryzae]|uniref:Crp/Fnr family transcriptional regulator n=1 Tax=Leeia oryzae TaxID=356662 RepID=UPI00037C85EA|nr:Crp/Fnr family transcriptional regulator [Leeia oryzae]